MAFSKQQLLLALLCILPVLGLMDTAYLTYKGFSGGPVVCNVVDGCSVVLESSWSTILGIQTALYGTAYYGVLVLFAGTYVWWRDKILLQLAAILSTAGLLFSGWLVYVQLGRIGAICEYCMVSAGLTTLTVITAWLLIKEVGWHKKKV